MQPERNTGQRQTLLLRGLRDARLNAGLSLNELSQRTADLGTRLHTGTLSELENGRRSAHPKTARRLADTLGVSIRQLRGQDDSDAVRAASPTSVVRPPKRDTGATPKVEVMISREADEDTARMLEQWIEQDAADAAAGKPDPWPEIERALEEDRLSYRKLFERE